MPKLNTLVKALAITAAIGIAPFGFLPTAAAAPGSPANTQKLMKALSNGYTSATCAAVPDLSIDAIAVVDCKQNTLAGGPGTARYILYANPTDLANHFTKITGDDNIFPCAAGEPAPQTWHYDATPDVVAGQVSCGTYNDTPELVWTNTAKLMMVSSQGPDINALYTWWLTNG